MDIPKYNPKCQSIASVGGQAAEERGAALAAEVGVLGEELMRVGAVAARATTREIAGGSKDDGVVPVAMHLEEARAPASHMLAYPLF